MLMNVVRKIFFVAVFLNISGCASYYSHYGSFTAQNSSGDARLFVVSWKTEEYPSWAIQDSNATPIVLEAQCSERQWQMVDSSMQGDSCTQSNTGIVACGTPGLDLNNVGQPIKGNSALCVSVSDNQGSESIVSLGKEILIKVSCIPASTTINLGDEVKGTDYLRSSVVPYNVSTRKIARNSFGDKAPVMSDKICDKPE